MTNKLLALIIALQTVIIFLVLAGRPPTVGDINDSRGTDTQTRRGMVKRILVCRPLGIE